jgi:hypothetical protein
MNPNPKPITLAEIHSAYASKPSPKKSVPAEAKAKTYAKSTHFDRDPTHSGNAPEKPDAKRGGRR